MKIKLSDKTGSSGRRLYDGRCVRKGEIVEVPDEVGKNLCRGKYFVAAGASESKPASKAKGKGGGLSNV
jgi:hypothetical protein